MAHLLFPSILSANFGNLQHVCEMLNNSEADGFHLDVMDGLFVPNISFGFPVIKTINKYANKPIDIHLMIVEPDRYLQKFKDAGATTLTVHYEACADILQTVKAIKKFGIKVCIAINPQTSGLLLKEIISDIDEVCVMSVNPGFGGQSFIDNTYQKVEQIKEMIRIKKSNALLKIDGGVTLNNCAELIHAGADILVAGTSVFNAEDPVEAIRELKKKINLY
ncbi:MAG TPA: ribulose-phosphate 3-epimerase [Hanamia sp.]